jgi:hypothetical protein
VCVCLHKGGCNIFTVTINSKLEAYYRDILGEEQNSVCKDRSCADGYFTLKLLIAKTRNLIEKHTK